MHQRAGAERFAAGAENGGRRRCSLSGDASKCLRSERVHFLSPSETRVVDYPKSAVLVPWEIAEKMIFWVHIVAEGLGTEEGVNKTTVRELAEYLYNDI